MQASEAKDAADIKRRTVTSARLEVVASEVESLMAEIILFLEELLEESFSQPLPELIDDGVVLCRCVQKLVGPDVAFKFHAKPKQVFHKKENVSAFVHYCEKAGIRSKLDVSAVIQKEDLKSTVFFLRDFAKHASKQGAVKPQAWMSDSTTHTHSRPHSMYDSGLFSVPSLLQSTHFGGSIPKPTGPSPKSSLPSSSRPSSVAISSTHTYPPHTATVPISPKQTQADFQLDNQSPKMVKSNEETGTKSRGLGLFHRLKKNLGKDEKQVDDVVEATASADSQVQPSMEPPVQPTTKEAFESPDVAEQLDSDDRVNASAPSQNTAGPTLVDQTSDPAPDSEQDTKIVKIVPVVGHEASDSIPHSHETVSDTDPHAVQDIVDPTNREVAANAEETNSDECNQSTHASPNIAEDNAETVIAPSQVALHTNFETVEECSDSTPSLPDAPQSEDKDTQSADEPGQDIQAIATTQEEFEIAQVPDNISDEPEVQESSGTYFAENDSVTADSSDEETANEYYPESANHSVRSSWAEQDQPNETSYAPQFNELRSLIAKQLQEQEKRKVGGYTPTASGQNTSHQTRHANTPGVAENYHGNSQVKDNDEIASVGDGESTGGECFAKPRVSSVILSGSEDKSDTVDTLQETPELSAAEVQKRATHRENVTQELIATESDYVRDLKIVVQEFLEPLQSSNILSSAQINEIFLEIRSLYNLHVIILEEFNKNTHNVGGIFVKYGAALKLYSNYCAAYDNILAAITKLRQSNSGFRKFLKSALQKEVCRGLDLSGFLIKPVQRICKYPLLLRELLKYTPSDHKDYQSIDEALQIVNKCAAGVNQKVREMKNNERLLSISSRLEGCKDSLLTPTRKFIMEAPVRKYSSAHGFQQRRIIIFNDMIMLVKDVKVHSYKWKESLTLQREYGIREYEGVVEATDDSYGFEIVQKTKFSVRGDYSSKLILFTSTGAERAEIMQQINYQLSELTSNNTKGMKEWKIKSLNYTQGSSSGDLSSKRSSIASVSSEVSTSSSTSSAASMLEAASSYSVASLTRRTGRRAQQSSQQDLQQSSSQANLLESIDNITFSDNLVEPQSTHATADSQSQSLESNPNSTGQAATTPPPPPPRRAQS
eukprot:TRINITY_DN5095_c0_g1_i1.p1 TRINITY_DN5095_c0_g1~~TRINITY_DN5095_c0_g1_i1.p1  ORF type:complete len:1116 (+),score=214.64 TRINITY_DN5095_c0_g1_i1:44-3391(+)